MAGIRSNPVDKRYLEPKERRYQDRMNAKSRAMARLSRGNLAYQASYNPSGVVPKSMQGDPLQNNYQGSYLCSSHMEGNSQWVHKRYI